MILLFNFYYTIFGRSTHIEDIRVITYADALKVQTTWELGDIELLAIRIQYLDDISQSEPAELTKYEIIGLLSLTKHLTLHSKVKADLKFEGKAVENYVNLARNH